MFLALQGDITSSANGPFPITDPVLIFAAVMLIILVAPLLMSMIRVPGMIGLILAGVLIGPGGFGVIHHQHDLIRLLAAVGLLYIMFQAGLDIDPTRLARNRRSTMIFGILTFIVPQTLGTAMALLLLGMNWPAAILLASMFASHTLVSYPIAARLGITSSRAVTAGVGGTIITDTLALLILAVIAASQGGELTITFWIVLAIALAMYGFIILWGVPRLGRWYFRHFADGGVRDFVFVLGVVYSAGFLARVAGIEPIIGAFLAGLALARLIPVQSTLMSRLKFVGGALFIPFFLVSIGMYVDVHLLLDAPLDAWLVIAAMSVTVMATKYLAAKIAQRILKYTPSEGNVLFGLSVPQAAATLAAVFIGVDIGLFDIVVLNGAIVMILVTCLIGPWFVERSGRTVALAEDAKPYEPGTAPLRILVPMANPGSALPLLDLAFMIRRPDSPEPVYPLTVANESGNVSAQVARGEQMLGHAVVHSSNAGVPVAPITSVDLDIASGIGRAIKEHRISTVVIGWSGREAILAAPGRRGGAGAILGSVLDRILEDNPQTVLVCRLAAPIDTNAGGRIALIVPRFIEREPAFPEAVRTIKQLASRLKARLIVFASDVEAAHLEKNLKKIRPQAATEFRPVASWPEVDAQIAKEIEDDDLMVMFNTREGRLPWSPDLHRLPRVLAGRFAKHNLVVFYPSEITAETAWFAGLPGSVMGSAAGGAPPLSAARTKLDLPSMPYDKALYEVIAPQFAGDPGTALAVRDALAKNARDYSTEVAPGVALLHAHVPHVTAPMFFLATCAPGIEMPRARSPVHVLLILLSPRDLPPEAHLRSLASIARLASGPDMVERLLAAKSFHQLADALGARP